MARPSQISTTGYLNTLRVTGPPRQLLHFASQVRGDEPLQPIGFKFEGEQMLAFNALFPIPKNLTCFHSWRTFAIENWGDISGCWDVSFDRGRNDDGPWLLYNFHTWKGPPQVFMLRASAQFPDLLFELAYYFDAGYPKGSGTFHYRGGKYLSAEVRGKAQGNAKSYAITHSKFSENSGPLLQLGTP